MSYRRSHIESRIVPTHEGARVPEGPQNKFPKLRPALLGSRQSGSHPRRQPHVAALDVALSSSGRSRQEDAYWCAAAASFLSIYLGLFVALAGWVRRAWELTSSSGLFRRRVVPRGQSGRTGSHAAHARSGAQSLRRALGVQQTCNATCRVGSVGRGGGGGDDGGDPVGLCFRARRCVIMFPGTPLCATRRRCPSVPF